MKSKGEDKVKVCLKRKASQKKSRDKTKGKAKTRSRSESKSAWKMIPPQKQKFILSKCRSWL
jgi:hypothetical protein